METIYLIKTTRWGRDEKIQGAFISKSDAWQFFSDFCYYQTPYLRPNPKSFRHEMFYGAYANGEVCNRIFFEEKKVNSLEEFIKQNNVKNNDFRSRVILMG